VSRGKGPKIIARVKQQLVAEEAFHTGPPK